MSNQRHHISRRRALCQINNLRPLLSPRLARDTYRTPTCSLTIRSPIGPTSNPPGLRSLKSSRCLSCGMFAPTCIRSYVRAVTSPRADRAMPSLCVMSAHPLPTAVSASEHSLLGGLTLKTLQRSNTTQLSNAETVDHTSTGSSSILPL